MSELTPAREVPITVTTSPTMDDRVTIWWAVNLAARGAVERFASVATAGDA